MHIQNLAAPSWVPLDIEPEEFLQRHRLELPAASNTLIFEEEITTAPFRLKKTGGQSRNGRLHDVDHAMQAAAWKKASSEEALRFIKGLYQLPCISEISVSAHEIRINSTKVTDAALSVRDREAIDDLITRLWHLTESEAEEHARLLEIDQDGDLIFGFFKIDGATLSNVNSANYMLNKVLRYPAGNGDAVEHFGNGPAFRDLAPRWQYILGRLLETKGCISVVVDADGIYAHTSTEDEWDHLTYEDALNDAYHAAVCEYDIWKEEGDQAPTT